MSDIGIKEAVGQSNSGSASIFSPDDEPNQPRRAATSAAMSWSLGTKIYHTAIPCFLAFLM